MRRNRKIREHRERLLKERSATVANRRRVAQQRISKLKIKSQAQVPDAKKVRERQRKIVRKETKIEIDYSVCPASKPGVIDFATYQGYKPLFVRPINVVHVLDSSGLGGAQTMAMELMLGLDKYYGESCKNKMLVVSWKHQKTPKLFRSYGVTFEHAKRTDIGNWCKNNNIDIFVHHRTSQSQCFARELPSNTKYVLINHTWNHLSRMQDFLKCDYYVSVCDFLHKRTSFRPFIDNSRKLVILNGVENDYIDGIQAAELSGDLKTGRCHRLVPSKFSINSLRYMINKIVPRIPGFTHHLIGHSQDAKNLARKNPMLHYHGGIVHREKKMAILKALDVYYYETYGPEGASVAVLESLACGVPVICNVFGGNTELVHNGINGFIAGDSSDFMKRLISLYEKPEYLQKIKQQTIADFNARLHVKHTACKYMQVFEKVIA